MVLLNIQNPADFSGAEDDTLVRNALSISQNPYRMIGLDANASDRMERLTFSFNYFRLGEERREHPSSNVQRRIVVVDGSTRELLFSLTPTRSGNGGVTSQIQEREQEFIALINSIELPAAVVPEVSVSGVELNGSNFVISFNGTPGQTAFTVLSGASPAEMTRNLTAQTQILEASEGVYTATVILDAVVERQFFQIRLDP